MVETVNLANRKDCCWVCGSSRGQVEIRNDHVFPVCMLRRPEKRVKISRHPLMPVVWNPHNKFPLCVSHHQAVDKGKLEALGYPQFDPFNPLGLIEFIRESYLLSDNPHLRVRQLNGLIETHTLFASLVPYLNGNIFDKDWLKRFRDAGKSAKYSVLVFERMKIQTLMEYRETQISTN